jgi:flagellar hook-basal body complex protein FliE
MSIQSIQNIQDSSGLSDLLERKRTIPLEVVPDHKDVFEGGKKTEGFNNLLSDMVNEVNELQHVAGDKEKQFLRGEISDVHEVMIAGEEASVAFSLLLEIRNKLLDAYREVMRMRA